LIEETYKNLKYLDDFDSALLENFKLALLLEDAIPDIKV